MDNFNTMPTGTPEERRLVNLKKEMGRNIDALRNRMGGKWHFDAINTLNHTHHISQVLTFYAGWQQEVENKRKPDMHLPDLNAKPVRKSKPEQYDKAA